VTTSVATMAAAVLAAPRRTVVEAVPVPEPGPGEVLVRIEGCGICASSIPVWEGRPWFSYPLDAGAPGHEGWGIVEGVGRRVHDFEPGQRVALLSGNAFAEHAVAPTEHCVAVDEPIPLEPLACAVNVMRRADVGPTSRVAIVGIGFLGTVLLELCRRTGAKVVPVRRNTDVDGQFDRVIECAGTQSALDTASRLVTERGRLIVAGFHQDGSRTIDLQSWNWRGIDVINAHERDPQVCAEGMRTAASLELEVAPLLTHRFPLSRIDRAFDLARTRPPGFVKAWVEP
jgi:threonine dehydrogenase-like Zn-dependent dehydrogenase